MEIVLRRVTVANGYNTDAGLTVTTEPAQMDAELVDQARLCVLVARQERPTDPAMRDRGRLTTLLIAAQLPTGLDDHQARLDEIVADVEAVMDKPSMADFPPGWQWPRYVSMEPGQPRPGLPWNGALITYQTHIPIR